MLHGCVERPTHKSNQPVTHHHICVRHMLHRERTCLRPRRRLQLPAAHADKPERARPKNGAVQACSGECGGGKGGDGESKDLVTLA